MDGSAQAYARLCVLASGSAGNCSVLCWGHEEARRVILIDMGLSPRRTMKELAALGMSMDDVTDVLVTHFDQDHWNPAWNAKPWGATLHIHQRHVRRAERSGALHRRTEVFTDGFAIGALRVEPMLNRHDELGSAAFRFSEGDAALGFATDLGRVSRELIEHFCGVDVLAIESNYCPRLQEASGRPRFLKERITGGAGHLSNQQCREAAGRIGARRVVLLHLSRECNRPEIAASEHANAGYEVTVASQYQRTPWVPIERRPSPQGELFAQSLTGRVAV